MSRTVRALFTVSDILYRLDQNMTPTSQVVKMHASYDSRPDSPNRAFWQATPTANLEMSINNPDAFDFYKAGKSYWIDFTLAEET